MPLEKSPFWTDLYYGVVAHYFWRPQAIGRISDPSKAPRPWPHWEKKLSEQESPLNHILDIFFHIAPQELLDRAISAMSGKAYNGMELVAPSEGLLDAHVVQPDIILHNGSELVFVEMKVNSRSSIDQFIKYAIAAQRIAEDSPDIRAIDLVILGRRAAHSDVWRGATTLGLRSNEDVRRVALLALSDEPNILKEKGVQRFLRQYPDSREGVAKHVREMGLRLADYGAFKSALLEYAAEEKTVQRLVDGVIWEFDRRGLVGTD